MLHRHFRDFCSFYARKLAECVVGALYFGKAKGMGEDFANAREVRNFFGSAVVSQADRLYGRRACPTRICAGWKKAISSTTNG